MKKQLLALVLALLLCMGLAVTACAETTGNTGGCTWQFDSDTGVLTISGTGAMADYTMNDQPWNSYKSSITSVVIEDGVTSIGNYAFLECTSLTSVTIPGSVKSIGSNAFDSCSALTNVTIPDGVETIGDHAFMYCTLLTSVTIPDGVKTIGDFAFDECAKLDSVTIPGSVTTIGNYAFWKCTSLKSVTISEGVTTIGESAFSDCSALNIVTIPDSVTTIGPYAFFGCSALESVTIPGSVTTIGKNAFMSCTSLTSVTISDGVNKTIGENAFFRCSALTSVTIPGSVTSIGNSAFHSCGNLETVTIYNGVTTIGSSAFNSCGKLTTVTIPDSVTSIGSLAFSGCTALENVSIPGSVETIGYYAFNGCSKLTTVNYYGLTAPTCGSNVFGGTNGITVKVPVNYAGDTFAGIDMVDENKTLPATYTITYMSSNSIKIAGLSPANYTYGKGATLPEAKDIPSDQIPAGYHFSGWYMDAECSDGPVTAITAAEWGDKTFFAKWEVNTVKAVVEPSDKGTVTLSNRTVVDDEDVVNGSLAAIMGNRISIVCKPVDGYVLKSLTATKDSDGSEVYLETASGIANRYFNMPASNVTVKAVFAPEINFTVKDISYPWNLKAYTVPQGTKFHDWREKNEIAELPDGATWQVARGTDVLDVTADTVIEEGDCYFPKWVKNGNTLIIYGKVNANEDKFPADYDKYALHSVDGKEYCNMTISCKVNGEKYDFNITGTNGERNWYLSTAFESKGITGTIWWLADCTAINSYTQMPLDQFEYYSQAPITIGWDRVNRHATFQYSDYYLQKNITQFTLRLPEKELTITGNPETYDLRTHVEDGREYSMVAQDSENKYISNWCAFSTVQHKVEFAEMENGTVTADKQAAESGETVKLIVQPNPGYTLETLTVAQQDYDGEYIPIDLQADGSFVMPELIWQDSVLVTATFKEIVCTVTLQNGREVKDGDSVYLGDVLKISINVEGATYRWYWMNSEDPEKQISTDAELTVTEAILDLPHIIVEPLVDGTYIDIGFCFYPVKTYTVTIDDNKNGTVTADPTEAVAGVTITLTIEPADSYALDTLIVDGESVEVSGNEYSFRMPARDVNVTATFKPSKFCITFDANGGIGTMEPQEFTAGVEQELSGNTFRRLGYTFAGWNTAVDGSGTAYVDQQLVTILENVTLYAQWKFIPIQLEAYTVRFDANGGEGAMDAVTFYKGLSKKLPVNSFVREGYTFDGWTTEPDGQGYYYGDGWNITVSEDMTLYAQWKKNPPAVKPEYKIEVDGSKGTVTRLNDTSVVHEDMYIRYAVSGTVDGEPFMVVDLIDVKWDETQMGVVGTFSVPNLQSGGSVDNKSFVITTDDSAHKHVISDVMPNAYGVLVK